MPSAIRSTGLWLSCGIFRQRRKILNLKVNYSRLSSSCPSLIRLFRCQHSHILDGPRCLRHSRPTRFHIHPRGLSYLRSSLSRRSIKISRRKSGNPRRNLRMPPKEEGKSSQATNANNTQDFVPPTSYAIRWDEKKVAQYLSDWEERGYLTLKPEKLKWTPFFAFIGG